MSDKEFNEARRKLHLVSGERNYHLELFGDEIAKIHNYKQHYMDAVHFYIVNKYNWLPSVVRSMSSDDLRFLLDEEMSGWVIPKEAR